MVRREPVTTFWAASREVEVYEPRTPCELRAVIALAGRRAGDVGVVLDAAQALEPVLARLAAAGVVAVFTQTPDDRERAVAGADIERVGFHAAPALSCLVYKIAHQALRPTNVLTSLSPRERDVVRLLAEHLSTRAIAARLYLSEHTVRNHLANIYRKLDVTNRAEAIALTHGALAAKDGDRVAGAAPSAAAND